MLFFKFGRIGIEIFVMYEGKCWDGFMALEICERRSISGEYYCVFCLPEFRKYYSSREHFWVEHSFEPFLDWTNSNFTEDKWLCLFGGLKTGATWAEIATGEKLDDERAKIDFVTAIPIINRKIITKSGLE